MHDLTILFLHHKQDTVTLAHHRKLLELNSHVPIVPLCKNSLDGLSNKIDVDELAPEYLSETPWYGADTMIYAWYKYRSLGSNRAKRYAVCEWDMLFTESMRNFYESVWDADISGKNHHSYAEPSQRGWPWFREIHKLPAPLRPFASGITMLAGTLISDDALQLIVSEPIPLNIFCELRLGTLARQRGLVFRRLPSTKTRNLHWHPKQVAYDCSSSVYHPIKALNPKLHDSAGGNVSGENY